MTREERESDFRTQRYGALNKCRWDHFLSMGIPIAGKTVFEPGAGIGDQTEWLLKQGVKFIYVNDGHTQNVEVLRERFVDEHEGFHPQLEFVPGDLETCLGESGFAFHVDFIFCWGVYYHLRETCPEWHIMRGLANIGDAIAFDYLEGTDNEVPYGYDNPSTSLSQFAFRPRTETLMAALKDIWGYAYLPKQPLNWVDPVSSAEDRRVAVASHAPIDNTQLVPWG